VCVRMCECMCTRIVFFNSKWPTIPQVFIGGEFVGGCDIVTGLYQSGELSDMLIAAGAKSAAAK
jgi:monothiol glutaredoxin